MDQKCISKVLEKVEVEMGWDKKYAVPEFDNETMALLQEIRDKEMMLAELDVEISIHDDKKLMAEEAIKGFDHELTNIEALIRVKQREEEIQKDLAAVTNRKASVLSKRAARMKTDLETLAERKENLENHIFRADRQIKEFQKKMNWDEQTIEAFLKKSAQREEEAMAVVKYALKDDKKVKALTLAIEKKTVEVNDTRKVLDKRMTENKCLQFALDKGTENLRKTYKETREMNQLWEDNINQKKQRNAEMEQYALQLAQTREEYKRNLATMKELTKRLDIQDNNNKEMKWEIAVAKHKSVKLQKELLKKENNIHSLHDEVGLCRAELRQATANLKSLKSNIFKMKKEIRDNNEKLQEQEAYNAALVQKLQVVTERTLTEEERAAQMEQFLKGEEQMVKELDDLLCKNNKALFLATEQLEALMEKEKVLIAHISNSKLTLVSENKRKEELEKILTRQRESVYKQSAQVNMQNRRLAVLKGQLSLDEHEKFQKKISEANQNLEEKKETAKLLRNALKESENAIRRLKKEHDKAEAQKGDLSSTVDQLMVCCNGKKNNLTTLQLKKEECMVRCQFLKMEVERLSNLLHNKADRMLSLEKKKLKLQKAIKERLDKINIQRDVLRRQLTLTDQDRQKLSTELSENLRKADNLKKRFEVMAASMAVPSEEEESAQAYMITQATLEFEELRRKRDALDVEIQKLEGENVALQNGNLLFDHHNSHLQQGLKKVDESCPEVKEKLQLEEQLKAAKAKLTDQKILIKEIEKNLQDKLDTYEALLQKEEAEREKKRGMQIHIAKMKKEISAQNDKIARATKQCSLLIKQIRSAKNTKTETLEEKDIKLKALREFSRNCDRMLIEAMETLPDLKPVLQRHFQQAGLSLPAAPSSVKCSSKTGPACRLTTARRTCRAPAIPVHVVDVALGLPPRQKYRTSKLQK